MGLREKDIEIQVGYWLRSRGIFFFKVTQNGYYDARLRRFRKQVSPFSMNGVSDLLCCINGLMVAIELKSKVGRQSPAQKLFQDKIERAGGKYFVVRDLAQLKQLELESLGSVRK